MKKIIPLVCLLVFAAVFAQALTVTVSDYDPKPAEAGKFVNVWFKVENNDDDPAEDVSIEVIPKDGLELTSGEPSSKFIGIIPDRTAETVQFRMKVKNNAVEGANKVEVRLQEGTKPQSKKDLDIEVTEKDILEVNLGIGDIESDPTRIKPDDDNVKLEVTIQNLGDGKAQGVKAELTGLPSGITLSESYSGTSLLGNIEADSTSKAIFYVDVDELVDPNEYVANLKLIYKYKPDADEDDYLFEEDNLPLRIAVRSIPLYNITLAELKPAPLRAGDKEVRLRLTIENIGEEEGESVRLKAYGKTEQPISFKKASDFVAPVLKPGETGQATLEFDVEEDANLQSYWVDIEIKNVVGNDVLTYRKKVEVPISYPKKNNPWQITSIGIIAIAIVIGIVIYRRRKKKSRGPKKVQKSKGSYLDNLTKK